MKLGSIDARDAAVRLNQVIAISLLHHFATLDLRLRGANLHDVIRKLVSELQSCS